MGVTKKLRSRQMPDVDVKLSLSVSLSLLLTCLSLCPSLYICLLRVSQQEASFPMCDTRSFLFLFVGFMCLSQVTYCIFVSPHVSFYSSLNCPRLCTSRVTDTRRHNDDRVNDSARTGARVSNMCVKFRSENGGKRRGKDGIEEGDRGEDHG